MYHKNDESCEIVLVKEFRSPCDNDECFVYEVPGGSAKEDTDPIIVAKDEVKEETGITINVNRLKHIMNRQASATLSAHKIDCYAIELTDDEIEKVKKDIGSVHGIVEDTERTYLEVKSVDEILSNNLLDWNNIGMILSAIR